MKCGLIWARSARTSASISRVRLASSSASASWPETQLRDLLGRAEQPGRGRGAEHLQRADDPLLHHQRCHDAAAHLARGGGADQVGRLDDDGAAVLDHALGDRAALVGVVDAAAVPGEHAGGIGERDCRCPEQGVDVLDRPLGGALREPEPERGPGQRGGVEGPERGPVGLRSEMPSAEEAAQSPERAHVPEGSPPPAAEAAEKRSRPACVAHFAR